MVRLNESCSMVVLEIRDKKLISTFVIDDSGGRFCNPWPRTEVEVPTIAIHDLLTHGWNIATVRERTFLFDSPSTYYYFTRRNAEATP